MLQTLLHIPAQLHGFQVFGLGLLLGAWAVFSVILLAWLVRRQGWNADTLSYLPLLAVVAAVIVWVLPALCDPKGLPIRGYGVMVLSAVLSGVGLLLWRARRAGVDPEMILTLAFWMILPGIVGARVVYVVQYWYRDFWPEYASKGLGALVFAVLNVAKGGLVVYGSFLGGMVGLYLFWRKHRIPVLSTADLFAPSLMLGLALGRIGCLMNGCCFGGPCELPWAISFPWDSPVHVHQVTEGGASIFGLKLTSGPEDSVLIAEVEPDSPAGHSGLRAGQQVREINGLVIDSPSDNDRAKRALSELLSADKLHFRIRTPRGEPAFWTIDDPPPDDSASSRHLRLFGLEVAGGENDQPVITRVAPESAEWAAGLRPGQEVLSVNGQPVQDIGRLSSLIERHRTELWAEIRMSSSPHAVEVVVPRPLPGSRRVHPTQLYAAITALVLCLVLLVFDPFARRDGMVFALLLTLYPIARILEESIRTDEPGLLGTTLHLSQFISLGILVFVLGLWVYIWRQPEGRTFVVSDWPARAAAEQSHASKP